MKPRLLIWGAGGHGKVVADTAIALCKYREIAFIDDDPTRLGQRVIGIPVIGASTDLAGRLTGWEEAFIAIGDNGRRADAWRRVKRLGYRIATLQHPLAAISPFASVAEGTLVMPRAVINANAIVGKYCIVNSGAIVEHDCIVEDGAHISPAVSISGGAWVGECAHLGIGSIVLPGVRIGKRAVIGAGGVVCHDLPADVLAVGVPARIVRYQNHEDPSFDSQHHGTGKTSGAGGVVDTASFAGS